MWKCGYFKQLSSVSYSCVKATTNHYLPLPTCMYQVKKKCNNHKENYILHLERHFFFLLRLFLQCKVSLDLGLRDLLKLCSSLFNPHFLQLQHLYFHNWLVISPNWTSRIECKFWHSQINLHRRSRIYSASKKYLDSKHWFMFGFIVSALSLGMSSLWLLYVP